MEKKIKEIIKVIIPPFLLETFKTKSPYGFFGNYSNWKEALADSKGYNDPSIILKVKNALLEVKSGRAVFERDSVIFDRIHYSWPLLAHLLWIASKNNNTLDILDFGGSLGSSYFQNKSYLKHLKKLRWSIVEQDNFVRCGKKYFEDESLSFFSTINDCMVSRQPHVLILSSVIQYIEAPYDLLEHIAEKKIKYIIFDKTSFTPSDNDKERIVVQKIRPEIYNSSYPCWILNQSKLIDFLMKRNYILLQEFNLSENSTKYKKNFNSKGLVFELN